MIAVTVKKGKKEYTVFGVGNVTRYGKRVCFYIDEEHLADDHPKYANGKPETVFFMKNAGITSVYPCDLDFMVTDNETRKALI